MCGKHEQSDDFFETGLAEKHIIKSPHIACKKCLELASKYYCNNCGNSRYFYNEMAIKMIDNKQDKQHDKIMHVDPSNVDNYFEPIYCYKCETQVSDPMKKLTLRRDSI
ncbi:hypothetical protein BPJM79_70066 [Bacillus pumilus]